MLTADDFPQRATVRLMRAAYERNPKATACLILDHELDYGLTGKQKEFLSQVAGRCR